MKIFLCLVMLGFVKLKGSEKTEHLGDDLEPASNPRLRSKGSGTGSTADWNFCSAGKPCGHGQGDCDGNSQCKSGHYCGDDNCGDYHNDAQSRADCCVDPEECGFVISGDSYVKLDANLGALMFQAYHVVTNEEDFWLDFPSLPSSSNYWLVGNKATGTDAQLFMTFACKKTIRGFLVKNTHNAQGEDRGTANFSILIWDSDTHQWTEALKGRVPSAINVPNVPVHKYPLDDPVTTDKVIFQIDSYYVNGGGLQYFATY